MQNRMHCASQAAGVKTLRPMALSLLWATILAVASPAFAGFINQSAPTAPKAESKPEVTEKATATEAPQSKLLPAAIPGAAATNSAASVAQAKSAVKPRLQELGQRPATVYEPKGKGVLIALADVMPVIAPKFQVDYADVSRTVAVNWSGGKPWPDVLADVVAQMPGATATIDWTNAAVTFGLPKLPAARSAPQLASERIAERWEVRAADLTLRQTLMRWAKDAGWQVSWEVKYDFPVQLEAAFGGTFENAIEQFTASLRASEFPLLGCLYEGNRVVRILHYGDNKGCDK